jgi:hypothetical protein
MRLNIKAFGLTCGLFWGFGLFLLTWWIIAFGLIWALLDGFIGGAIFAWLYNLIIGRIATKAA